MSLGQLVLELKLNGNEFTVGLKSASGQLGQFVAGAQRANTVIKQAERSTYSWGRVIRDTIIGFALARDAIRTLAAVTVGWQKSIIDVNSSMEKSIMLMKNFSKETDSVKATTEAVADVNRLLTKASTSPFSLTAITDAFVKLRVGGVEPAFKSMDTLIDSVAAFGGSGEQLKRAGVAIQQMAGKGVVSMEELRQQLGEAVPTAINAMADGLGTTYQKLVKEISQGKVLSKPAIIAMMQELERSFAGSAGAMMDTWGGAVAQFETGAKRLAVAFGGLEETGYSEDGYLKTVTNELKELNKVLASPEMMESAKELGKSIAEMVTTVATGTKWIIEHREAIYEWGKALLYLWAAYKGASIIGGVLSAAGAASQGLAMKLIQMRMQGQSAIGTFGTMAAAMTGWNSAAAVAAGGAVKIATGSTAAGTAVRLLGGALGVLAGPIGMVTALAISGGIAWYEYKKGINDAEKAVLSMQGALTTMAQLQTLGTVKERLENDYKENFVNNNKAMILYTYGTMEAYLAAKKKAEDEITKVSGDMLKARQNVSDNQANILAQNEIQSNSKRLAEISRKYVIDKEAIRKKMEDEAKTSGKKLDEDKLAEAFVAEQKNRVQAEIDLYEGALTKLQEKQKELQPNNGKAGSTEDTDIGNLSAVKANEKAMDEYRLKISEAKDSLLELGKVKLPNTLVDPGGDGKPQKPMFDAMTMYVDGLRKSVAGLGAKLEETNPYLAQLDATVESLGGKKLPNFDTVYAEGKKLAELRWEQEKAQKALTAAGNTYKDSMERIEQIERTVNNKLAKVENTNPWENASADAKRYEEELNDLIVKMNEAQLAASGKAGNIAPGQMEKLQQAAREAEKAVDDTRASLERLKVVDTGKAMETASQAIRNALASNSEKAKMEYDRQTAWADEFYANHKEQLDKDSEAYAQYDEYRKALDAQYAREQESGLAQWIRLNKDATDQYKSLWGSAMDKFTDTLVDGLSGAKMNFQDFVVYVLKEFLRIQVARTMAFAADAMTGGSSGGGWLSGLMSVGSSIAGAFNGTGANGFQLGSIAEKSSSLGATAAGYGSQYLKFANGGIMTEFGEMALRKYAKGGIADRPQMAIYGEGDMNEAFVPLPDGRSIPVTMKGNAGGQMNNMPVNISIVVNKDGTEVTNDSDSAQFNEMAGKIKTLVKEVLLTETRPGGIIDKRK
jgi:tape measure domain-containing protein